MTHPTGPAGSGPGGASGTSPKRKRPRHTARPAVTK